MGKWSKFCKFWSMIYTKFDENTFVILPKERCLAFLLLQETFLKFAFRNFAVVFL